MPDHIFGDGNVDVALAVVDLEPVADEARDDGAAACHGFDGRRLHSRLRRHRHVQRDYERSCVFVLVREG
jgi:hypothetical protein